MKLRLLSVTFAVFLSATSIPVAASTYQITEIVQGSASDINIGRQVVGSGSIGGGGAYIYDSGIITPLGGFGGVSVAMGINDSGLVSGFSKDSDGNTHAFLYDHGVMTNLGGFGGTHTQAGDINNSGQIVGFSAYPNNTSRHAFLYENGSMTDLGSLDDRNSGASDINDKGQVVGGTTFDGGDDTQFHAYLLDNGFMTDLGTLGGLESRANGINELGQIVGGAQDASGSSEYKAVLWDNGNIFELPAPGFDYSVGNGINDSGQVVGHAINRSTGQIAALLWEDGNVLDLCALVNCTAAGWESFETATAINNRGDIVGIGRLAADGNQHAFLISVIPIPPAVWLFGSGLIGLVVMARRRTA